MVVTVGGLQPGQVLDSPMALHVSAVRPATLAAANSRLSLLPQRTEYLVMVTIMAIAALVLVCTLCVRDPTAVGGGSNAGGSSSSSSSSHTSTPLVSGAATVASHGGRSHYPATSVYHSAHTTPPPAVAYKAGGSTLVTNAAKVPKTAPPAPSGTSLPPLATAYAAAAGAGAAARPSTSAKPKAPAPASKMLANLKAKRQGQ